MPIARNEKICKGAPTIVGRRLMVSDIVYRVLVDGVEITQEDLSLSQNQIKEAIVYCSQLRCMQSPEDLPFCQNCSLRALAPKDARALPSEQCKRPTERLVVFEDLSSTFLVWRVVFFWLGVLHGGLFCGGRAGDALLDEMCGCFRDAPSPSSKAASVRSSFLRQATD